jgi:polysaccharide biosynthesis transport protein
MELKEYLIPLRRWWWLIVAATLLAAGSSYYDASRQPAQYQSRTTLMIGRAIEDPNPNTATFHLGQQLAQTYADMARRQRVQQATQSALGLTWLPSYTARAVPNNQLIEIIVTDTSPERAQAVANELARQLILQSPTAPEQEELARQEFINRQLATLEANIEQTQADIEAKQAEINTLQSARQIADMQNQIDSLQTTLNTLRGNYGTLLANTQRGAINTLAVIEEADLPTTPVGADLWQTVLLAAAIGFILAAGAAFLMEYIDDTVKTPDDIKRLVDLPTLAGIVRVKGETDEDKLVLLKQPRAPVAEAFRSMRTAIQFSSVDRPDRATILITSSNPMEGKSMNASNLALAMAQAGQQVVLVDADLRRPRLHKYFDLPNSQGLTNLLLALNLETSVETAREQVTQMVQETAVAELKVLTSGPIPPNPSEMLGSAKMQAALDVLQEMFDFVIIDSPPALAVTDAVVLATRVDSVLLLVEANRTRRGQLTRSVERLRDVNAKLIGTVLNRLQPGSEGYGYYYYYQSSYYGPEETTPAANRGWPILSRFTNGKNGHEQAVVEQKEAESSGSSVDKA